MKKIAWYFETTWVYEKPHMLSTIYPVYDAVQKLVAARAPKDPVKELTEAWAKLNAVREVNDAALSRIGRAIAAIQDMKVAT